MICNKQKLGTFFTLITKLIASIGINKKLDIDDIIEFINKDDDTDISASIEELLKLINCDTISETDKEDIDTLDEKTSCFSIKKSVDAKYYNYTNIENELNCCNCISFIIYSVKLSIKRINWLRGILLTLYLSLHNIGKYLDDLFIAKIYLDISVFIHIFTFYKDFHKDIRFKFHAKLLLGLLLKIINNDISEIYIYFCKDVIDDGIKRIYRFLPFIQKDTNVCISWDVDNLMTHNICLYIKQFYSSDKLFFVNKILDTVVSNQPYQQWLLIYQQYKNANEKRFVNLLAGCFGLKIKVKKEDFYRYISQIKPFFKIDIKSFSQAIAENGFSQDLNENNFSQSFDEILLYELFEKVTSDEENNKKLFFFISQLGDSEEYFTNTESLKEYDINQIPKLARKKQTSKKSGEETDVEQPNIYAHFKFEYYLEQQTPVYDIDNDPNIFEPYKQSKDCYTIKFGLDRAYNISNYTHSLINNSFGFDLHDPESKNEDIELISNIGWAYNKITPKQKFEKLSESLNNFNAFIKQIYTKEETKQESIVRSKYLKYKNKYLNYKKILNTNIFYV